MITAAFMSPVKPIVMRSRTQVGIRTPVCVHISIVLAAVRAAPPSSATLPQKVDCKGDPTRDEQQVGKSMEVATEGSSCQYGNEPSPEEHGGPVAWRGQNGPLTSDLQARA